MVAGLTLTPKSETHPARGSPEPQQVGWPDALGTSGPGRPAQAAAGLETRAPSAGPLSNSGLTFRQGCRWGQKTRLHHEQDK